MSLHAVPLPTFGLAVELNGTEIGRNQEVILFGSITKKDLLFLSKSVMNDATLVVI